MEGTTIVVALLVVAVLALSVGTVLRFPKVGTDSGDVDVELNAKRLERKVLHAIESIDVRALERKIVGAIGRFDVDSVSSHVIDAIKQEHATTRRGVAENVDAIVKRLDAQTKRIVDAAAADERPTKRLVDALALDERSDALAKRLIDRIAIVESTAKRLTDRVVDESKRLGDRVTDESKRLGDRLADESRERVKSLANRLAERVSEELDKRRTDLMSSSSPSPLSSSSTTKSGIGVRDLEASEKRIVDAVRTVDERVKSAAESFERRTTDVSTALERQVVKSIDELIRDASQSAERRADDATESLERQVVKSIDELIRGASGTLEKRVAEVDERVKDSAETLERRVAELDERVKSSSETLEKRVEERAKSCSESLERHVSRVGESLEKRVSETEKRTVATANSLAQRCEKHASEALVDLGKRVESVVSNATSTSSTSSGTEALTRAVNVAEIVGSTERRLVDAIETSRKRIGDIVEDTEKRVIDAVSATEKRVTDAVSASEQRAVDATAKRADETTKASEGRVIGATTKAVNESERRVIAAATKATNESERRVVDLVKSSEKHVDETIRASEKRAASSTAKRVGELIAASDRPNDTTEESEKRTASLAAKRVGEILESSEKRIVELVTESKKRVIGAIDETGKTTDKRLLDETKGLRESLAREHETTRRALKRDVEAIVNESEQRAWKRSRRIHQQESTPTLRLNRARRALVEQIAPTKDDEASIKAHATAIDVTYDFAAPLDASTFLELCEDGSMARALALSGTASSTTARVARDALVKLDTWLRKTTYAIGDRRLAMRLCSSALPLASIYLLLPDVAIDATSDAVVRLVLSSVPRLDKCLGHAIGHDPVRRADLLGAWLLAKHHSGELSTGLWDSPEYRDAVDIVGLRSFVVGGGGKRVGLRRDLAYVKYTNEKGESALDPSWTCRLLDSRRRFVLTLDPTIEETPALERLDWLRRCFEHPSVPRSMPGVASLDPHSTALNAIEGSRATTRPYDATRDGGLRVIPGARYLRYHDEGARFEVRGQIDKVAVHAFVGEDHSYVPFPSMLLRVVLTAETPTDVPWPFPGLLMASNMRVLSIVKVPVPSTEGNAPVCATDVTSFVLQYEHVGLLYQEYTMDPCRVRERIVVDAKRREASIAVLIENRHPRERFLYYGQDTSVPYEIEPRKVRAFETRLRFDDASASATRVIPVESELVRAPPLRLDKEELIVERDEANKCAVLRHARLGVLVVACDDDDDEPRDVLENADGTTIALHHDLASNQTVTVNYSSAKVAAPAATTA